MGFDLIAMGLNLIAMGLGYYFLWLGWLWEGFLFCSAIVDDDGLVLVVCIEVGP